MLHLCYLKFIYFETTAVMLNKIKGKIRMLYYSENTANNKIIRYYIEESDTIFTIKKQD